MLFTVRELIQGQAEAVTVQSDATVQHALVKMIEHDFSQLPVVDGDEEPGFMVSSDSILRALDYFDTSLPRLHVGDAMIAVPTFSLDTDVLQVLDPLRDTYAVLGIDNNRRLAGIVTSYDVTEFFRRQTEDSLLVRDIEQMLRDLILAGLGVTEADLDSDVVGAAIAEITPSNEEQKKQFRKALAHYLKQQTPETRSPPKEQWVQDAFEAAFPDRPRPKEFNDLTLYEFIQLLLQESRWDRYSGAFGLDREPVRNALDAVRQTRNDLFHFRGDLTPSRRAQLRFCRAWLGRHRLPTPERDALLQIARPTIGIKATDQQDLAPIGEELGPRDSRYVQLAVYLQGLPQGEQSVVFKFEEVERVVGEPLPASARQHRAWWANDTTSQAHSREWLDAGWRVATVDIPGEIVEFARSRERRQFHKQFFDDLVRNLEEQTTFSLTPSADRDRNWLVVGHLPQELGSVGSLLVSFVRLQRIRVELYIPTSSSATFERLRASEGEIADDAGERLYWETIQDRGAHRVATYRPCQIDADAEQLVAAREWAVSALNRLSATLVKYLSKPTHS